MFKPTVHPLHARMLCAVCQDDWWRRQLLACASYLEPGTCFIIRGQRFQIKERIGQGYVGIVYHAVSEDTNQSVALKIARGNLDIYKHLLQLEVDATAWLNTHFDLQLVETYNTHSLAICKPLVKGKTFQTLYVSQQIESYHIQSLMHVLHVAQDIWNTYDYLLDISPKNIAWSEGTWILLDPGQPIINSRYTEHILHQPCYSSYIKHYQSKMKNSRSEPGIYAQSTPEKPDIANWNGAYVFVKEWNQWFPMANEINMDLLILELEPSFPTSDFLFIAQRVQGEWTIDPLGDMHATMEPIARSRFQQLLKPTFTKELTV